jgi:hypothetical protein
MDEEQSIERRFSSAISGAFAYAFKIPALVSLLLGGTLIFLARLRGETLGIMILILTLLYLLCYYLSFLKATIQGRSNMPLLPDLPSILQDLAKIVAVGAVSFLPVVGCFFLIKGILIPSPAKERFLEKIDSPLLACVKQDRIEPFRPPRFQEEKPYYEEDFPIRQSTPTLTTLIVCMLLLMGLFMWGVIYYPIGLLGSVLEKRFLRAINPLVISRYMKETSLDYLICILLFGGGCIVAILAELLMKLHHSYLQFGLPVTFLEIYLYITTIRITGLLYRFR